MRNKFLIIFILSIGLYSCEYEKIEAPVGIIENVSFSNDIIPIFNQSCNAVGCHNAGGISPDLSVENAFTVLFTGDMLDLGTPENSELYKRMIDVQKPMPLSGILSKSQTDKVLVWIEEGANDN
ncbi:MAG: hypothetical protein KAI79_09725 [Bacteroidales bacterium]|nr:hypothetical protein [Bacteroidales bacterium]